MITDLDIMRNYNVTFCSAELKKLYQNELMATKTAKKEAKLEPKSFRFRPEATEQLNALAQLHDRSLSNMLEQLIKEAYQKQIGDKSKSSRTAKK